MQYYGDPAQSTEGLYNLVYRGPGPVARMTKESGPSGQDVEKILHTSAPALFDFEAAHDCRGVVDCRPGPRAVRAVAAAEEARP
ncbi:hypothetical protein [Kitasatospora sp. NPDC089509]|uniref:hypothetical protein n=1 Tax=Kitasatospora sp. NPDC089509 TaxID=3364079 RepID=UPI0038076B2B